jgi:hypothetical protein
MIKDTNGVIYTHDEFLEKRMKEIQVNINYIKALAKRLDSLEVAIEKTNAYKQSRARLDIFYKEINQHLPEEKHNLTMKLDDLFIEVVILYEEYFYKHGYYDGRKFKGPITKAKEWFSKHQFQT